MKLESLPDIGLPFLWQEPVAPPITVAAKVVALTGVPAIGARWQGGIYAGVARGVNGANDHYLIVADTDRASVNWKDAKAWAAGLEIDGNRDFTLPTCKEQALLFANAADLFEPAWYWSSEQHASDASYAWVQLFGYGNQDFSHQSNEYRARAVRRIKIEL